MLHSIIIAVADISAWNYPYFVGSNVLIPALLTGNACIYKPSEYATLTGKSIVDCMYEVRKWYCLRVDVDILV